ncbi:RNA-directed DNA polymerase, eukaryota [Tanacetum coccineum]
MEVGEDVSNAVKEFFNSSIFPNGCNPSFIALNPKILDGPLILNEIVSWCKSRKEQALLFKVDFQKAFDSVRWDHLDDILGKFGFGSKWRGWIRGCLHSSKASVLVNGMFVPILVGKNDLVPISHLFYADDAMFIDIKSMASSFGCLANNLLFTYLGVKVAANMARINSWNKVIQKVIIKLSKWKAKSLSVGGRLTLLKSVLGSLPTYYISLFKAPDGVLSHLERLRSSFFLGAEMDEPSIWAKVTNSDFCGFFEDVLRGGIEESHSQVILSLAFSVFNNKDGNPCVTAERVRAILQRIDNPKYYL